MERMFTFAVSALLEQITVSSGQVRLVNDKLLKVSDA